MADVGMFALHPSLWKRGKLIMLRTSNEMLRRLSKANNTVFCGRILMLLAHFFPLSERSALNLISKSNIANVTSECPISIYCPYVQEVGP